MKADSETSSMTFESFKKRYKEPKFLRSGSFSSVSKYKDTVIDRVVAFKEINLAGEHFKGKGVPSILVREASLLKNLQHENIVSLLGVVSNESTIGFILEYAGTDLENYRLNDSPTTYLDARTVKSFLYQILAGVAYCHSMNIIHRDLRPDNVLIDEEKQLVKIADFGMGRLIDVPMESYTQGPEFLSYLAPEILHDKHKYSSLVDVWAVGCMFAEMVTGDYYMFRPTQHEFEAELHQLDEIFSLLGSPDNIEDWPTWKKFCEDNNLALKRNSKDLSQKFFRLDKAGVDLLTKMLCIDPRQRITASEALKHEYFRDLNK